MHCEGRNLNVHKTFIVLSKHNEIPEFVKKGPDSI